MGRLKALASRLQVLRPQRLREPATKAERDRIRNKREWRAWYHTKRWKRMRWAVLLRDEFTCRRCGDQLILKTRTLVADHIVPHRGDEALFWDERNLQTLCASCHSGAKQRDEVRAPWKG